MLKYIHISIILVLQLFIVGCGKVDQSTEYNLATITVGDINSMLSKELKVNDLYDKLGPPKVSSEGSYGNIMYQTPEGDYLFFNFKGPYVVGARYKDVSIEGVSSKVLRLYVNYIPSEQLENKFTFEYAINKQSFNEYEDLKNYLLKLDKKYVVEYQNTCGSISQEQPFNSEGQIEDFKLFCKQHDIVLLWYPSG